ncbi:MAG: hypothetical protein K9L24_04045 [Spirochaetia bacterium]|nr:hypothetical protein [Spirochaetia bacterium]MCF7954143.1 hypothetical protein [Spirochaetales bacterium]
MAKSISLIGRLFLIIIFGAALFGVIYYAFPETSEKLFGMSGSRQEVQTAVKEAGEAVSESLQELQQSLEKTGASDEEVSRVMEQLDPDTVADAVNDLKDNEDRDAEALFEELEKRVDFGMINTEEVKKRFLDEVETIDFKKAFSDLENMFEGSLESLSESLKDKIGK